MATLTHHFGTKDGIRVTADKMYTALPAVTKRRNSWACRGNPNPEQEAIKGTHTQETPDQRRPTTQYAAQGSNPPIGRYTCSNAWPDLNTEYRLGDVKART